MFLRTLLRIAKTCKQPKCPSPDEWIGKMWHGVLLNLKEGYSDNMDEL